MRISLSWNLTIRVQSSQSAASENQTKHLLNINHYLTSIIMRRKLRLLIVFCLLTLVRPMSAYQIFDGYNGSISFGIQTPVNRVVTPLNDGFRVTYSIPDFVMEENETHPGTYRFRLNEFNSFTEPGAPALPSKEDIFYVLNSESASVEIVAAIYKDFSFNIASNTYETVDGDLYGEDVVTPFDGFHVEGPISGFKGFTYRDRELVKLNINPILYNYREKKIRVYTTLVYKINYNIKGTGGTLTPPNRPSMIDFDWREISRPPYTPTEIDTKTMLIVAPDSLFTTLHRFVEWKKTLGIDTYVLTEKGLSDGSQGPIPFTFDAIKASIEEFYSSHPKMEYLLIIGNGDMVPGYNFDNMWQPKYREEIPFISDFQYSALFTGLFPLFKYGRIPATNSNQLNTAISKIIKYEKDPPADYSLLKKTGFYNTGTHMAYLDIDSWPGKIPFGTRDKSAFVPASEEIANYITKVTSKKINRLYSFLKPNVSENYPGITQWSDIYYTGDSIPASLGLFDTKNCKSYSEFVNELNNGRFYAMYLGHGGLDCFYNVSYGSSSSDGYFFNSDWVAKLKNQDKLPVIFSMSCSTGNFIHKNNLGAAFLFHENGGAIGFMGNSAPVLKGPNELLGVTLAHSIWPTDTLHSEIHGQGAVQTTFLPQLLSDKTKSNLTLGEIHLAGIAKMRQLSIPTSYYAFHCLGDPSMEMRTECPAKPMTIYTLTDSTLTVSAPDSECRISIYDRKNQIVQSVVGQSYVFAVEKGEKDISLCVNNSNCIPFIVNKLEITSVNPPIIIVNCESLSSNSIDVTCSVGEDESDVSLITTNMLTGETSSIPVTETGKSITHLSVSKAGNYVVGLTQRGQLLDSKKIIVK